jgi:hypothetical protein
MLKVHERPCQGDDATPRDVATVPTPGQCETPQQISKIRSRRQSRDAQHDISQCHRRGLERTLETCQLVAPACAATIAEAGERVLYIFG